jgi:hypothetical protein
METRPIPDFKDVASLALFLAFFILGFIMMQVYAFLIPGRPRDFSKQPLSSHSV